MITSLAGEYADWARAGPCGAQQFLHLNPTWMAFLLTHIHRCKAPGCRGTVTSTDWKLPEVQQRYWPCFPPFVKRLILKHVYAGGGSSPSNGGMLLGGKSLLMGGMLVGPPPAAVPVPPQGAGNPEPHPFGMNWSS